MPSDNPETMKLIAECLKDWVGNSDPQVCTPEAVSAFVFSMVMDMDLWELFIKEVTRARAQYYAEMNDVHDEKA